MPLRSTTVLVVDDNRHMRAIHRAVLRSLGAKVIEAEDGQAALEAVEREKPDLIVTDFEMPRLSGAAMVGRLRRSRELERATTPVVMVTGHAGASRIYAARDAGVDEVCTKPISPAVLWTRLAAAAGKRRQFVVSPGYVGPCRRRRAAPVATDRRAACMVEV